MNRVQVMKRFHATNIEAQAIVYIIRLGIRDKILNRPRPLIIHEISKENQQQQLQLFNDRSSHQISQGNKMIEGSLCHELEVALPADELWEIYSTLQLAEFIVKLLPNVLSKVVVEEGDGGVGTILVLTLAPGFPGPSYYKEKFTKIDNEKRLKESIISEGGYLDLGFTAHLTRLEIIEKTKDSSIIRSTVEYEISEEHKANASFATTKGLAAIAEAVSKYLLEKKANEA